MTPKTNYLFARVEQTVNLQVRNAVVKFYMKHPGLWRRAANLQLAGPGGGAGWAGRGCAAEREPGVDGAAGTPGHSCIFAVVRSDAEQDGNQSVLDWWQFENLSHKDNDWAQRNLDIEDYDIRQAGDSEQCWRAVSSSWSSRGFATGHSCSGC